jgi:predicted nucleic acid-binding protein
MLILADTGILLRLMERADPQHATIRSAVRNLVARGDELVTATQNVAEFWNVCTRPPTARGGLGLSIAETDRRLRVVERFVQLLADLPAAYRLWRQLVVNHSVLGRQVHDARLAALMQAHAITHILTLNGPGFARYPGITPIDPAGLAAPPPAPAPPLSPIPPDLPPRI